MTTPTTPEPFKVWTNARGEGGFLHGTKAELKPGDLIEPGRSSNYGSRDNAAFVYLTSTLDAATWGAELAIGDGPGRSYIVEPTGPIEDDPNLTDKRFPGKPTRFFRTGSAPGDWRDRRLDGPRARAAPGDEGWPRAPRRAGCRSHQPVAVTPARALHLTQIAAHS